ncbi:hypothetical protein evm_014042 [Chilo suppressalis]|nr:hypothetical protein evm_014042 [Chilo suppressalis]
MAAHVGNIEHFDVISGDFAMWLERFEQYMIVNDVAGEKKVPLLLTFIGPEGYKGKTNLVSPKKPSELQIQELITLLKQYFTPRTNIIAQRFKFYKTDQEAGESIKKYVIKLKEMASTCGFQGETLKEALRDRLVCGLNDENLQRKILSEAELLSFDAVYERAITLETTFRDMQLFVPNVHKVSTENNKDKIMTCGRCGGWHNYNNCRAKSWKCFKCNKMGHSSKMCRSKTSTVKTLEEEDNQEIIINRLGNAAYLNITINDRQYIRFEVDTGACQTVMCESDLKKYFPDLVLSNTIKYYTENKEVADTAAPKSCNLNWCNQTCRRMGYRSGVCVNGRCKCDLLYSENPLLAPSETDSGLKKWTAV